MAAEAKARVMALERAVRLDTGGGGKVGAGGRVGLADK